MTTKVEKPIDDILDLIEGTATGTPAPEDLELIAHCYEAMAMAEGNAPATDAAWRQFEARQRTRGGYAHPETGRAQKSGGGAPL